MKENCSNKKEHSSHNVNKWEKKTIRIFCSKFSCVARDSMGSFSCTRSNDDSAYVCSLVSNNKIFSNSCALKHIGNSFEKCTPNKYWHTVVGEKHASVTCQWFKFQFISMLFGYWAYRQWNVITFELLFVLHILRDAFSYYSNWFVLLMLVHLWCCFRCNFPFKSLDIAILAMQKLMNFNSNTINYTHAPNNGLEWNMNFQFLSNNKYHFSNRFLWFHIYSARYRCQCVPLMENRAKFAAPMNDSPNSKTRE